MFSMILWMSFGHKIAHRYGRSGNVPLLVFCKNLLAAPEDCKFCSSRYIGEGMAASLTGLVIGLILLSLRETKIMSAELAQQLLTFNHTNFFV